MGYVLEDRYHEFIDLNKKVPITTALHLERLCGILDSLSPEIFHHEDTLRPDEIIVPSDKRKQPREITPADKYPSYHVVSYRNLESDILVLFYHFNGPYGTVKTDESCLIISGPNKEVIGNYLVDFYKKVKKDTILNLLEDPIFS